MPPDQTAASLKTEVSKKTASNKVPLFPVLEIKNLQTQFTLKRGIVRAVDDISLSLHPGRTLCVVGESGSGKSVMARSILNIVQPGKIAGGSIRFWPGKSGPGEKSIDICTLDPRGPRIRAIRGSRIAMIFQEPMASLSPIHTIGAQIIEAIRIHQPLDKNEARLKAIELLHQVQIPDPEITVDRYPFQYSGGMRQRAMIAMALSSSPRVLIADEPTTALDVTTQAKILKLIKRLQHDNGMAVLFITHDMGVVAEIADDVAVMRDGKILEYGPVDQVFSQPRHDYSKQLIAAAKLLEGGSKEENRPDPTTTGQPKLLAISNISLKFGGAVSIFGRKKFAVQALKKVSLDLYQGESLGIVGESGSGKTTLARCILGLYQPQGGRMDYQQENGEKINLSDKRAFANKSLYNEIRMIFQDPFSSLNPRMTVEQIIAEPMIINKTVPRANLRERVAQVLADVNLPSDIMDRYPYAFSGGQRQRISIARAIALNPRLIVADEATSALDGSLRTRVLDLLLELRERLGLSFLFISHDIGVVRYFCERIAVMRNGEVVELGLSEQICDNPQHPYTQELIAAVPKIGNRTAGIKS